jgi:hypothetical protein
VWTDKVEAQRDWRWANTYSLGGSVGVSYSQIFGDSEGSALSHGYSLGFGGPVVDRRLMTFSTGFSWSDASGKDDMAGGDQREWGASIETSFFNQINRNRGLKLWKYVPSPLTLMYRYHDLNGSASSMFAASGYYSRPGYITLFHNKRWIHYNAPGSGRGNTVTPDRNTNRYRTKYNNNWNRNGAGNWNRNGAGNWNRNGAGNWNAGGNGNWNAGGNGNWNRNGNGNWNRNGNGNWNRNGNGNWNRGGNGNWNAGGNGDWNRGGNGNWSFNRNQLQPERPWGFRFPNMSFWVRRTAVTNNGSEETNTIAAFRASTGNRFVLRGRPYRSSYTFVYSFEGEGAGDFQRVSLSASNRWARYTLGTSLAYTARDRGNDLAANSQFSFGDRIWWNVGYAVRFWGSYQTNSDGESSDDYGGVLNLRRGWKMQRRLSPKLVTTTRIEGGSLLEVTKDDDDYRYTVRASEAARFDHIRWFPVTAIASTGFSGAKESEGFVIPLNFSLSGSSRGFRKLSFQAGYQYGTAFFDDVSSHSHQLRGGADYRLTRRMSTGFSASYSLQMREGDSEDQGSVAASYRWSISTRSNFRADTSMTFDETRTSYDAKASYRRRVSWRGSLSADYARKWEDGVDGAQDTFSATYSWQYGRFSLNASYSFANNTLAGLDTTSHAVRINIRRSFSRSIRMLF